MKGCKMEKIKFDKKNYRKHNDRNKELIKKSLSECGAGRSILIDKENEIIAGNGIYEQAKKLNIPVKIIETDGSELVVVKRTDLQSDDEKRKQLAIMDNSTSDTSEFDIDLLQEEFETNDLNDWGINIEIFEPTEEMFTEKNALDEETQTKEIKVICQTIIKDELKLKIQNVCDLYDNVRVLG